MTDTLAPTLVGRRSQILPYAQPEPAVPAELEVREILYTAILSVTQGLADPQTALDQAAQKVNAVLAGSP
jgi:maltose-binding protein MalE